MAFGKNSNSLLQAIHNGKTGLINHDVKEQIVEFSERAKKPIFDHVRTLDDSMSSVIAGYEHDNSKPRIKIAPLQAQQSTLGFSYMTNEDEATVKILEINSAQIGMNINYNCATCPNLEVRVISNSNLISDEIIIRTTAACKYGSGAICPDEISVSFGKSGVANTVGTVGSLMPQHPRLLFNEVGAIKIFSNESNWAKHSNDRDIYPAPIKPPKVELEDIKFELNVLLNDDFGLF